MIKDTGTLWLQVQVAYVERKDGTKIAVIGTKNVDELVLEEQKNKKLLLMLLTLQKRQTRQSLIFFLIYRMISKFQ